MVARFVLTSVEIPPIKVRIKVFDLVRVYIEATYKNLVIMLLEKFIDNVTINIITIKNCINKREKKDLIQLLKNQLKESVEELSIANGARTTKTFTIINLTE